MDELTGRTAVITGGASGMGRAFADRFAAAGMNIVIADIEQPPLDAAVEELRAGGASAIGVVCDVADEAQNHALFDRTIEEFGQANILCLNAGVGGGGEMVGLTTADWQWVLGVNLWGVIHGMNAFMPHIREHGDGHMVVTASVAGHTSNPRLGPYNVSKHGVATLAESLFHELAEAGSTVGVSCLCPGIVNTRILESDRNRPEQLTNPGIPDEPTEEEELVRSMVTEYFKQAKPPSEVADLVHDAVLSGQFWIFTDHEFDGAINQRHTDIRERTNPTPPGGIVDTESI